MHFHAAPAGKDARRTALILRFSLAATLAYVVVTFVAGLRAHSLALLSEAGHNVSDFLALLLSFAAVYFQARPADHARTFGYQRAGVLAAFINAATLIAISLLIAVEAVHRLSAPVAVQPRLMMIVAAAAAPSCTWPATRSPPPPSSPAASAFFSRDRTGSTPLSRCSSPRSSSGPASASCARP
jgi:Co/Zn/Cd efflux system component